MDRFFSWGNRLHSGETSLPFVPKARLWLSIAAGVLVLSAVLPFFRGGFNLGIEFTGGSSFAVSNVQDTSAAIGEEAVSEVAPEAEAQLVPTSDTSVRIQTRQLSNDQMQSIADNLVAAYGVATDDVTFTYIGPTFGQDIAERMFTGLVVFIALAALVLALYFRTWKMSAAAIGGLFSVMIITVGIYSITGLNITPAAVIAFLTVLALSLYDTVVVFDKVRENTQDFQENTRMKFSELVNLAVNQTTVRSINTSVVSTLPVAAVLFIGVFVFGAATLMDIALALFIGQVVAFISSLFVASPLYALLRSREPAVREQEQRVKEARERRGLPDIPPVLFETEEQLKERGALAG
ncbi:protein translocase subunit SecF [Sediminivirga luteola]|nr:protein translocase subunit SecF [Sediminivirga luteola]MCI2264179.1 protein translocase subunit SecF [Sediminivirga luteola]